MITKKLLEFQKLNIVVSKDGENPHFKSSYATINEVLAKVKKPLNDMGILPLSIIFHSRFSEEKSLPSAAQMAPARPQLLRFLNVSACLRAVAQKFWG